MNRKTFFIPVFLTVATAFGPAAAHDIEKPSVKGKTSFAVVVDKTTLERCRTQIDAYKRTVESEGLPTYIISDDWTSPEQIKEILQELHLSDRLEGAFLVGDVPIAMVTKAQHMTSAFKMDERKFPLREVSVPTDRFYDDFDLEFEPIRDSTDGLMHFYRLSPTSPQYIECDIYTGRIKAQESNGDKYRQISDYLAKAVAAHKEHNPFDTFVSYTGHGSYSDCITAWRAEQQILQEQFPGVFTRTNTAKFLRYSMEPYMKESVIRELRRPDLDFMVFHEHGMPERQYLSAIPQQSDLDQTEFIKTALRERMRRSSAASRTSALRIAEEWGLDSTWYAGADDPQLIALDSLADLKTGIIVEEVNDIAPNARMVIFDACYNGDYREGDFIAGKYIFSPGKCVAAFANSVNVLQDKSAFDLLGLLGEGVRLGNWAKHINILESHIIGDPTYHFTARQGAEDINAAMAIDESGYWKGRLDDPNPEIQNVAMMKLVRNDYPGISDILYGKMCSSPYAIVRYNALVQLEKLNDENYRKALIRGTDDNFEFIRRISTNRMGMCGDDRFLPYLVAAYVNDNYAARMTFNITSALLCFDKHSALKAIDEWFAGKKFYNAEKYRQRLVALVSDDPAGESLEEIKDPSASLSYRIARISFLRNRPYHQITDGLLEVLADRNADPQLRHRIIESLAWYRLSAERPKILAALEKMLAEKDFPTPETERELTRACTRLRSAK